jgi:preprotein translocase subunit SecF
MFHIIGKTNFDFIGMRKYAFTLSGMMVILGIIAFISILMGKAPMGIDFTGGTMVQGNFAQVVDIGSVRAALTGNGFPEAKIQRIDVTGQENTFLIRVKTLSEGADIGESVTINRIMDVLAAAFPGNTFTKDSEQTIGPAVGQSLRNQAKWAVILAVAGILLYIWIRFDFRFGVAATIATFHDVLGILGIFWALGIEIDLLVITALLTLAGYSLTDTVVVYDRIRENLRLFRKKGDFVATVNASINEVLSRTIMTSLTTLVVVIALLFFGGPVLRNMSLAMFMGIIIGTYSSWFVASPIVVEWEAWHPKRFK